MTDKYSDLKKAAEAATPGPWVEVISGVMPKNGLALVAILAPLPDYKENSAFIALANPDTVLALIAENEALCGLYRMHMKTETREMLEVKAERDQLKAEAESLRAVLRRVEKCTDGAFMVDGKWRVGDNVMRLVRRTLWPQPAPGGSVADWQEPAAIDSASSKEPQS